MRRSSIWLVLICLLLMFVACNVFSPGPSKTVQNFLYAIEKGNIDEARKLCSSGLQTMLGPKLNMVLTAQSEQMRQQGGIKSIDVKEQVVGQMASVQVVIKYGNGQSERSAMNLLKENGVWRISQ